MEWRVGGDDYEWQRGCHAASFGGIQGGCGHDQWRDSHGLSGYRTGEFQLEGALRDGGRRGKRIEGSDNERRGLGGEELRGANYHIPPRNAGKGLFD